MPIDPRKLGVILEIAEQGSISRAALSLRVAQPSLSRTVREFEEVLGVQVFRREPRGVSLTPDGERLVARARKIRHELHQAETEIADAHPAGQRKISIGIVPVHPIDPLIQSLLSLIEADPGIHANFITGTRAQLLDPLAQGSLDLILGPLSPALPHDGYAETVIYYEDLAIFCGPANRLFGCGSVSIDELRGMNWVLGPEGAPSRRRVTAFFKAQGLKPPEVNVAFEEVPARRAMVLLSDYLSVFQRQHVLNEIQENRIFPLPLRWRQEERPIGVTHLAAKPLSPAALAFVASVRDAFARSGLRTETQDAAR